VEGLGIKNGESQILKHVIFDLDNCLSHDEWRIPYIDWDESIPSKRYETYHRGCGMDNIYQPHVDIFRDTIKDATPVFLTGRPLVVRPPTIYWIKHRLSYEKEPILLMRNDNDERKSVLVKEDMLKDLRHNWDIEPCMAFDDRPEIVAMYIQNGVAAKQLAITNPDLAYVRPRKESV
jgi:hypothetical protein